MRMPFVMAVASASLMTGCATIFSADPINSQIVDEDTGAPIEGVVVVAHWELSGGSLSTMPCGSANVEEAVTDQEGNFHLPGWGPVHGDCATEMRIDNPILYVFKSGYGYGFFPNGSGVETVTVTHSSFDGRQLPLKKFFNMDLHKKDIQSYHFNIGRLNSILSNFIVDMPGECNWKKTPNMIRALAVQEKQFEESGNLGSTLEDELTSNDQWLQKIAPQCGSPKKFFEELGI